MHARCGAGEKAEITSKPYLLLSSNVSTPSSEDIEVTKRLVEAGQILGIEILDHLILCDDNFRSLKELGYI
ncbi:DNA repair protein RadC [Lysinibacillus antri]|uniref:DNA repair protein RadC n=1 Tax=Lysinibacillus antri TaxID=2498145 RepID=A0A3S0PN60_9BACI|nr:DNA repair protein RadC [Lysinibacillus antri]